MAKRPAKFQTRKLNRKPANRKASVFTRVKKTPVKTATKNTIDQPSQTIKPAPGSRVTNAGDSLISRIKIPRRDRDTLIVNPDIRPGGFDFLKPKPAPPLALLPMGLEYRFMTINSPVKIRDIGSVVEEFEGLKRQPKTQNITLMRKQNADAAALMDRSAGKVKAQTLQLGDREELWVRWYPHESLAEQGLEPITEDEAEALDVLQKRLGGKPWWSDDDPAVSAAWQTFAQAVGAYRAIYIMRSVEGSAEEKAQLKSSDQYQSRIGRFVALPEKVVLFASIDGDLHEIATGGDIPANKEDEPSPVSYTPEALDPGGWLVDFKTAIKNGMGIKISDPEKLKLAKEADWVIAIGLYSSDAKTEIETYLKSQIANGEFAVLPQDTPTNNTVDSLSHLTNPEDHIPDFTRHASAQERGVFDDAATNPKDADLLAEALGISSEALQRATGGDETGFADAKAMLRVIGPALLDDTLDGLSQVHGVSEDEFIEVLAASISARGALPAVRMGTDAMGVLPMTQIGDLSFSEEALSTKTGKVQRYIRDHSQIVRIFSAVLFENKVPVIEPGDPEASDKLNDILTLNRVSTRIDLASGEDDEGDTKAIGCPYVDGAKTEHKADDYLKKLRTTQIALLNDPTEDDRSWPLLYRLARMSLERNVSQIKETIFGAKKVSPAGGRRNPQLLQRNRQLPTLNNEVIFDRTFRSATVGSLNFNRSLGKFSQTNQALLLKFQRVNKGYADALRHLQSIAETDLGQAKLEVLMLEVIDLFQHRTDAFATGLAYARLKEQREAGEQGLRAGYYSFLGKLRPDSATGASDGYIHAPSTPQALTSALLRSAYLRNRGEGAFEINLNSRRVRNALKTMDLLNKGHSLAEALGLRGERWLHDRKLDTYILLLRAKYPIRGEANLGKANRRIFDGLDFLEDTAPPEIEKIDAKQLPKGLGGRIAALAGTVASGARHPLQDGFDQSLVALREALNDDLDAFTDIVMAEATHQRAMGRADRANAWLEVLSGHPIPGEPAFIQTQRKGQGSSYQLALMLEETAPDPRKSAREIVEPGVANLANRLLAGFDQAEIVLTVETEDGERSASIGLRRDLNMRPYDLVIGGMSEIQVRAKHVLGRMLASLPGLAGDAAATVNVELDIEMGAPSVKALAERAETLRKAVQGGRPLDSADLNRAANASLGELSELQRIDEMTYGIGALQERMKLLVQKMQTEGTEANKRLAQFTTRLNERLRLEEVEATEAELSAADIRLSEGHALTEQAFRPLAAFGEPAALRQFAMDKVMADDAGVIGHYTDIVTRVRKKHAQLLSVLNDPAGASFATQSEAKGYLDACIAALQQATDGEAIKILPPLRRNAPVLQPDLDRSNTVIPEMPNWAMFRERTASTLALKDLWSGADWQEIAQSASIDDTEPDPDVRSETIAPLSYLFGVFIGEGSLLTSNKPVCGVVCDEWTEQRPSEESTTGIAINYDSPQAEAPFCTLLCVAPNDQLRSWSPLKAAEMVTETISWMQFRALSSYDRVLPGALFPGANIVSDKKTGKDKTTPRIPTRSLFSLLGALNSSGYLVAQLAAGADLSAGVTAADLTERGGFKVVRE